MGAPVGVAGKTTTSPTKVFLPLSAFFLHMSGEMDGDGGEPIKGLRQKDQKRDRKRDKKRKRKGRGDRGETPSKSGDQAQAGSGAGDDAIGKDSTAGAAPKAESKVQTSAQEGAGKRYARMMKLTNVGGEDSCPRCGSEPGTNIDCSCCVDEGITTTANVATTPVPIGAPLRRVAPFIRKKRKKKKDDDERQEWAQRLVAIATPTK